MECFKGHSKCSVWKSTFHWYSSVTPAFYSQWARELTDVPEFKHIKDFILQLSYNFLIEYCNFLLSEFDTYFKKNGNAYVILLL